MTREAKDVDDGSACVSASKVEFEKALGKTLLGCDISNARIISYRTKAPPAPEGIWYLPLFNICMPVRELYFKLLTLKASRAS